MYNIKQINTGVAELLAVKVPEGASHFNADEHYLLYCTQKSKNWKIVCRLPTGNWTPLGIDTELTEEQCMEVMPLHKGYYMTYINNEVDAHDTAKEAFASLMQANGCYSLNPYQNTPPTSDLSFYDSESDYEDCLVKWQQAEANTGPRLILINQKDV